MATFWLANGVQPKVVSERLGYANVTITLQVYGHLLPNMQAEAANTLDGAFVGDSAAAPRVITASPRASGNRDLA